VDFYLSAAIRRKKRRREKLFILRLLRFFAAMNRVGASVKFINKNGAMDCIAPPGN
jgi:hypothetical protein